MQEAPGRGQGPHVRFVEAAPAVCEQSEDQTDAGQDVREVSYLDDGAGEHLDTSESSGAFAVDVRLACLPNQEMPLLSVNDLDRSLKS